MAMYVAGSQPAPVGVEEHRVGHDAEQGGHGAEDERLGGQPGDGRAASPARPGHAEVVSVWARTRSRTIATSAAMMPLARAGRSASSSSRTGLSIRSSVDGSMAVTEADRGSGTSAASSPTVEPGPRIVDLARTVVDPEPPANDREQVVLDGPFDDHGGARSTLHLAARCATAGQRPARDVGEQRDALERDDALDRRHRHDVGDRGPQIARRSSSGRSGRSQAPRRAHPGS